MPSSHCVWLCRWVSGSLSVSLLLCWCTPEASLPTGASHLVYVQCRVDLHHLSPQWGERSTDSPPQLWGLRSVWSHQRHKKRRRLDVCEYAAHVSFLNSPLVNSSRCWWWPLGVVCSSGQPAGQRCKHPTRSHRSRDTSGHSRAPSRAFLFQCTTPLFVSPQSFVLHQRWTGWRPVPALPVDRAGTERNTAAAGPRWALCNLYLVPPLLGLSAPLWCHRWLWCFRPLPGLSHLLWIWTLCLVLWFWILTAPVHQGDSSLSESSCGTPEAQLLWEWTGKGGKREYSLQRQKLLWIHVSAVIDPLIWQIVTNSCDQISNGRAARNASLHQLVIVCRVTLLANYWAVRLNCT